MIVYALVARERAVLAEFTVASGNFPTVERGARIPPARAEATQGVDARPRDARRGARVPDGTFR